MAAKSINLNKQRHLVTAVRIMMESNDLIAENGVKSKRCSEVVHSGNELDRLFLLASQAEEVEGPPFICTTG